ncbi:MAG: hypothetical protein ACOYL5_09620 [Phototrophicaceae bacterium]
MTTSSPTNPKEAPYVDVGFPHRSFNRPMQVLQAATVPVDGQLVSVLLGTVVIHDGGKLAARALKHGAEALQISEVES